jgi:hypothetical protein
MVPRRQPSPVAALLAVSGASAQGSVRGAQRPRSAGCRLRRVLCEARLPGSASDRKDSDHEWDRDDDSSDVHSSDEDDQNY